MTKHVSFPKAKSKQKKAEAVETSAVVVRPVAEVIMPEATTMEKIILNGDLSGLAPAELVQYYKAFCQRVGLDPVTKPFDIIVMKGGKKVLYATRGATAQLSKVHKITHNITDRSLIGDVYVVTCRSSTPDGRFSDSTGAVPVVGLRGEDLANAYMKAETKSKRRSVLDLMGLGITDDSEVDSIPCATRMNPAPVSAPQQTLPPSTPTAQKTANERKEEAQSNASANQQHSQPKDQTKTSPSSKPMIDLTKPLPESVVGKDLAGKMIGELKVSVLLWMIDNCEPSDKIAIIAEEKTDGIIDSIIKKSSMTGEQIDALVKKTTGKTFPIYQLKFNDKMLLAQALVNGAGK